MNATTLTQTATINPPVGIDPQVGIDLQVGIDQVAARLFAALDELFPPLLNLAQAHCRDVRPYTRAAIVLTTWRALQPSGDAASLPPSPDERGAQPNSTNPPDHQNTNPPNHPLILGSALEMLSVALSIHRLLLLPSSDNTLDKALVGSTILTGDYCFSRAASLAAQTESPHVVELFSRALKQVSEESLRGLFGEVANPHGEDAILAAAGVRAICHLLQTDAATTETQLRLGQLFALRQDEVFAQALTEANESTRSAWSALNAWRATHA